MASAAVMAITKWTIWDSEKAPLRAGLEFDLADVAEVPIAT